MHWHLSWRFDPRALPLADAHYNRQKPGTPQFVPPARCIVLLTANADALWVSTWPDHAQHAWEGAWINTLFRREPGAPLASELIRDATAATRWKWPQVPEQGMISFIDESEVRSTNPGYCYLQAGWTRLEQRTEKRGHRVVQVLRDAMPDPAPPINAALKLTL